MSSAELKAKKRKVDKDEEEDSSEAEGVEEKENESSTIEKNDAGELFVPLSGNKKRCTVRTWKKNILIDIREFYEKDGKMLPGKKGISLNLEDYQLLSAAIKNGCIDKEINRLDG